MASLDDILTTAKNIVTGVNGIQTSVSNYFANASGLGKTSTSLLKAGVGRLISFSVIQAGTAPGYIYDAATVDVVNGFSILSATVSGGNMTINFKGGPVFPVGSSVTLSGTPSGSFDGTFPVTMSSSGTVTVTTTLSGATNVGKISSGQYLIEVPNQVGGYTFDVPYQSGLVIQPGAGQIVSIFYQ